MLYNERIYRDELKTALEKGRVEGETEGRAKEKITIARTLLPRNMDINAIAQATGLPVEELHKLISK